MISYLLGLDLGMSGCKALLVDANGRVAGASYQGFPVTRPSPGQLEQDTELWRLAICRTIRESIERASVSPSRVVAVAATGQGSLVCYDDAGAPLRPAILHGDRRSLSPERYGAFFDAVGRERLRGMLNLTVLDEDSTLLLTRIVSSLRLLWLCDFEPGIFRQIHSVSVGSWGFVNFFLTGRPTWNESLALDLEVAELFDVPTAWFGEVCRLGEVLGSVSREAAAQTGLVGGTPVVAAPHDGLCNVLGAGLIRPNLMLDQAGTTEIVAVTLDRRPGHGRYPVRHLLKDLWLLTMAPMCGAAHRWFRDQFGTVEATARGPGGSAYDLLAQRAGEVRSGSDGLVFLPYLAGAESVFTDPDARGAFIGFSLDHSNAHFVRAVWEGLAYSLRHILEYYEGLGLGVHVEQIRVGGGGARGELLNQIKADVIGRELSVLAAKETGCLGAAILAGRGVGLYVSLRDAIEALVHIDHLVLPDAGRHQIYDRYYAVYKDLYPSLKPVFGGLAAARSAELRSSRESGVET